jgi:hypothetical protein
MPAIERERVLWLRQQKPAAEIPEMPEISNPSEIAAFSAMARSGGNWRKPLVPVQGYRHAR